ncbi:WXG100 family type VII secretion target, partial [Brachybacterium squillarum]|uniref:WXG100 family type VII secretion target n=1 Tax=Brachybacterium squillarum TaxID=661979 RepID=UPI0039B5862D|nr:hypothetical protein [Brachybacterium squillarum]
MSTFIGADTEALRAFGATVSRRADEMDGLYAQLRSAIDGTEWTGEDADRFRARWSGSVRAGLEDSAVELRLHARRLLHHAEEQDASSAPDAPGGGSGSGGGGAGSGAGGGDGSGGGAGAGSGGGASGGSGGGSGADGGAADGGATGGGAPGGGTADGTASEEGALAEFSQALASGDPAAILDALLGDRGSPLQQALGELLDTPEGQSGLLAGLLGGLIGSALSDMLGGGMGGAGGEGLDLESFLAGVGAGMGLAQLLSGAGG